MHPSFWGGNHEARAGRSWAEAGRGGSNRDCWDCSNTKMPAQNHGWTSPNIQNYWEQTQVTESNADFNERWGSSPLRAGKLHPAGGRKSEVSGADGEAPDTAAQGPSCCASQWGDEIIFRLFSFWCENRGYVWICLGETSLWHDHIISISDRSHEVWWTLQMRLEDYIHHSPTLQQWGSLHKKNQKDVTLRVSATEGQPYLMIAIALVLKF